MLIEAKLWRKENEKIRCLLCERQCLIGEGKEGFCKTRRNEGSVLYTLTYGALSAIESRPIEIKPFYHFYPGSTALTISTYSCNFPCPWCQNWHLSKQMPPEEMYVPPGEIVEIAKEKDQGICISFNEPTLLYEYCLALFPLARKEGLYTCMVSNGYMTEEALRTLREAGLDAIKIDIKGTPQTYREFLKAKGEIPWRTAKLARQLGVHLEIVFLMVSPLNDNAETIDWVVEQHLKNAGEDVPLHITRYFPAYRFHAPPTSIHSMEQAHERARKAGIKFVYLGNMPGHRYENTYCPTCGQLLIKRYSFQMLGSRLQGNKCPQCGTEIPIITGGQRCQRTL